MRLVIMLVLGLSTWFFRYRSMNDDFAFGIEGYITTMTFMTAIFAIIGALSVILFHLWDKKALRYLKIYAVFLFFFVSEDLMFSHLYRDLGRICEC